MKEDDEESLAPRHGEALFSCCQLHDGVVRYHLMYDVGAAWAEETRVGGQITEGCCRESHPL